MVVLDKGHDNAGAQVKPEREPSQRVADDRSLCADMSYSTAHVQLLEIVLKSLR